MTLLKAKWLCSITKWQNVLYFNLDRVLLASNIANICLLLTNISMGPQLKQQQHLLPVPLVVFDPADTGCIVPCQDILRCYLSRNVLTVNHGHSLFFPSSLFVGWVIPCLHSRLLKGLIYAPRLKAHFCQHGSLIQRLNWKAPTHAGAFSLSQHFHHHRKIWNVISPGLLESVSRVFFFR